LAISRRLLPTPPNFGAARIDRRGRNRAASAAESPCSISPAATSAASETTSVPQFQTPRSYNVREAVSWNRGAHALRFGGELLFVRTGVRDIGSLLGNFDLSGRFTGGNGLWENAIADLLLGFPSRYQQDSDTTFTLTQNMYFLFLQDDWKVNRKLTVNLGLRYEFATPVRERDQQWANFDPGTQQFVSAKEGSLREEALITPDRNNFAPRLGFAWTVMPKTVVRGAYGVFYNHTSRMGREGLLGFNPPFIILGDRQISGSNNLKAGDAIFRLQDGIPAGFVDISRVNLSTVGRKAQDPDQKTTYVQQFNVGIQRELAAGLVFDIAYVGNAAVSCRRSRISTQTAMPSTAAACR
jgi:hypothetical protein